MQPISWFSPKEIDLPKPQGYQIKSIEQDYRLEEVHHALWLGFNHGPDITYTQQELDDRKSMTSSPHFKKKYTFAAHHDNHYVAYAGIWFIEGSKTALIEPVATVPDHRRKGLAQACIYHAINEAKKDGAEAIFVGSNTKFYQDIGFKLYDASYRYTKKKNG
jgi:predicted N-acetyltransferase YhbS